MAALGRRPKFKRTHYRRDGSCDTFPTRTVCTDQKDRGPSGAAIFISSQVPGLLGGFGSQLFELGGFGRGAHRGRRSGAAGDGDGRCVEIAGANLALMPRRRTPAAYDAYAR